MGMEEGKGRKIGISSLRHLAGVETTAYLALCLIPTLLANTVALLTLIYLEWRAHVLLASTTLQLRPHHPLYTLPWRCTCFIKMLHVSIIIKNLGRRTKHRYAKYSVFHKKCPKDSSNKEHKPNNKCRLWAMKRVLNLQCRLITNKVITSF
jgi:hypothetical protein